MTQQQQQQQHDQGYPQKILHILAERAVIIGLLLRIFLAWFLPWLLDDGKFLPEVAYTDIDFYVFTDAAQYIQQGQSPYDRHTYRYTPFLAELLAHMPKEAGRYLFCVADCLCGWIIWRFRRNQRRIGQKDNNNMEESLGIKLQDALWWLYNPLAINICTRGSSESLMVLLPVLLTLRLVVGNGDKASQPPDWKQAALAGICHGIAIHSKLYPIIYSLSYMAYFATVWDKNKNGGTHLVPNFPWTEPKRLFRLVKLWTLRLFTPVPLVFLVSALSTMVGLTYLAVRWYGEIALQEGLLYHFSRVDHRHNYSMYWYWIYLARARSASDLKLMGRLLLLPQVTLLVYSSLGIAPQDLGLALFVQTYLFVTHNKVITAQYFTWYLCLLPLCSDSLSLTPRVKLSLALLLLSIGFWLGSAYCVEMQGMAAHKILWVASTLYFLANVNLMGALLRSSGKDLTIKPKKMATKQD